MLQIENIRKSYTTGNFTQKALDDVSITLRDNEFVAILGPSGSGKTTLLNIIGGLDHYDSGDLIIDGVSTKEYKDHDWDTYRNNRIGFVFQSYNLIPHQTVLANVELALTLSGVSKAECQARATEALQRVGLGDHINKKPSQLSGGQMQRVAIARALINDPDILLADEPTGALDSKTSVQIMDLLTEIAQDRLVVMVTHNPDLATQYANRIVNLSDGVITSDSNPCVPTAEELSQQSSKQTRRTSMGMKTALSLSFNNLMTKKARTIMTAIAGSIGIIGIAAILALANGVDEYIANVEEETLSQYPLQITSSSFSMTNLMTNSSNNESSDDENSSSQANATEGEEGKQQQSSIFVARGDESHLGVTKMVTNMFASIGTNDLKSLKAFFDSGESGIEKHTNAIEYSYNVTPQLFNPDTSDKIHQVNPDKTFAMLGLGSGGGASGIMTSMTSTNVFYEMPSDSKLYEGQYEIVTGRWPENYNECIVVVSRSGNINDFMLYALGLRDPQEMTDMIKQFMNEEEVQTPKDIEPVSYDTILNITFKLVYACDYYQYDSSYGVWVDKSNDTDYLKGLIDNGEDIHIVGIVKPAEDQKIAMLPQGINYPSSLTRHIIQVSSESTIVKEQLADPDIDVITGVSFEEEAESGNNFNMDSLFSIDTTALANAFKIDGSKLTVDMSGFDLSSALSGITVPEFDESQLGNLSEHVTLDYMTLYNAIRTLSAQYAAYCIEQGYTIDQAQAGFNLWLTQNPSAQATLTNAIQNAISVDDEGIRNQIGGIVTDYVTNAMSSIISQVSAIVAKEVGTAMNGAMTQLGENMASALSIDTSAFASAFSFNITAEDLSDLMASMMSTEERTYDNNLAHFGYADLAVPFQIDIYPIDFEHKNECINILDTYNQNLKDAGDDDKVIAYTDIVGALMSSVTDIIDMISMVLIAFVAISLIVSSIMIGVITYISVLERIKEIGILRAIGASKKDISHVFNAETIIEGFASGVIGIVFTAIACVVANIILDATGYPQVAQLPLDAAIILIFISILLTFVSGLIPARSASKKDPVEALRSE